MHFSQSSFANAKKARGLDLPLPRLYRRSMPKTGAKGLFHDTRTKNSVG